MKFDKRVTDISGYPQAGQAGNVLIDLPVGVRILDVQLSLVGGLALTATQAFGEVTLYRNGRPQRTHSIAQLDRLKSIYGAEYGLQNDIAGGPAQLWIPFAEWYRKQYAAQEAASWDVGGNETLQLEVGVLAAATGCAIEVLTFLEDEVVLQARPIAKVFRHQENFNGTQTLQLNKLTRKDKYGVIQFYDPTGATIQEVKITRDGKVIFDRSRTENTARLARHQITEGQGVFSVVADATDSPADWWDMDGVKELEAELTMNAAAGSGQVVAIVERYGLPE